MHIVAHLRPSASAACRALLTQAPALRRVPQRRPSAGARGRAGRWCAWSLVSLSMLAGNAVKNAGGGPPVEVEKKFELQGGAEERVAKSGLAYVGECWICCFRVTFPRPRNRALCLDRRLARGEAHC